MAATHTPQADKIHWHGGSHPNGGVSRFGEYFIAADRSVTFERPGAAPEEVPARSGSDADVYWATSATRNKPSRRCFSPGS